MKKLVFIASAILMIQGTAYAQCFEDRHNGNWFDGWVSCTPSDNPNPARGESHWIFYDLHHTYSLGESRFWNYNDPSNTDRGLDQVAIDYSTDGVNWNQLGIYNFPEAPGISTYEGFEGPDLGGVFAKYILITAGSNHGGDCYGLSELRIQVEDVIISDVTEIEDNGCMNVIVYPNPSSIDFTAKITSQCPEIIVWDLYDAQGKLVVNGRTNASVEENFIGIDANDFPGGLYHLVLRQGNSIVRKPLIKLPE
ncbi:MAG: T9SS type A sorting domain-containing protein [Flavobacteriales bacterium]|nr:T9SS type A sorting domain-containing protein [Flavobacteriales bacterium]